jgi:hypothetical protein
MSIKLASLLTTDHPFDRWIVVGDIHSCARQLWSLLSKLNFGPRDALVAVGDFLDRGPQSWEVATFLRDTPNAFSIYGNHERRIMRAIRQEETPLAAQVATLSQIPSREHGAWAAWLGSLPAVIETPHAIVCHARLDPRRPLYEQDHDFCSGAGASIPRDANDIPIWFHEWRGRNLRDTRPILFGHRSHDRVALIERGLYALDTNAAYGGPLTALIMPAGELVSMP